MVVLVVLIVSYQKQEKEREAELQEIAAQYQSEQQAEEEAYDTLIKEIESSWSVYQKLAAGYDVNILIIGDSIGAGSGADSSDDYWFNLLQAYLTETYMSTSGYDADGDGEAEYDFAGQVSITNVSMGGNASYAGYVRTMTLDYEGTTTADETENEEESADDAVSYDLAIICYGQNDSATDFELYYESILRAVHARYPNCSIISILESSQLNVMMDMDEVSYEEYAAVTEDDYTDKMKSIQKICDYYGIPVADTIAAFVASGYEYADLSDDGTHPNNDGQEIYYETVRDVIVQNVESATELTEEVEPYSEDVKAFDNFVWFEAEDEDEELEDDGTVFIRTDSMTYTLTLTETVSGLLGIDYTYESGENTAEIYIDGELYTSPTVTFDYDFLQRHILLVSTEEITAESEIQVVFGSSDQADGFYGMCFSWE